MDLELPEITIEDLFSVVDVKYDPGSKLNPVILKGFNGRVVIAVYSGNITVASADSFSPSLGKTLSSEVEEIILDFRAATKLSHTAVGILVNFAAGVIGRGKKLYLYLPPRYIEARLAELNVASFFQILYSEDDLFGILPID